MFEGKKPGQFTVQAQSKDYKEFISSFTIDVEDIFGISSYNGAETSITLPERIIGKNATNRRWRDLDINDYGLRSLSSTSIQDDINGEVTEIMNSSFQGKRITDITFSESLTSIRNSAFRDNILSSLTFPDNVTYIGLSAFSNNRLTEVNLPNKIREITSYAFANNHL